MDYSTSLLTALISTSYLFLPTNTSPAPNPAAAALDAYVTDAPLVTGGTPVTSTDVAADTLGTANVRNYCSFTVYLYVCGQGEDNGGVPACSPIHTLAPGTGTYSETYFSPNNGRSLKMSPENGEDNKPILQLEYTNTGTGQVSYDVSEVNGNPFGSEGFTLTASNHACFHAWCAPPATDCPGIFTDPTDGTPHDCPVGDSIGVALCRDTYTP